MNELSLLIEVNFDNQTVSARSLYKKLEVKYDFKRWVETNFKQFIENKDYFGGHTDVMGNQYGGVQTILDYDLTINMAEHLCLMSQTEKGMECRQYLINLREAWNTPEMVYARAIKFADRQIAELNSKVMRLAMENEEMKPKAEFADAITASKTTILVGDFAKILKQNGIDTGQNRLFKWFVDNHYLFKRNGQYVPTQRAMEKKLFEVDSKPVQIGDETQIKHTVRITPKGQQYFIDKFIREKEIAV